MPWSSIRDFPWGKENEEKLSPNAMRHGLKIANACIVAGKHPEGTDLEGYCIGAGINAAKEYKPAKK